jgi:hypothetical protein
VVFFCGSGVSLARARLPDFAGLANLTLQDLGAGQDSEARQLFALMQELQRSGDHRGVVSADVIFGKLAREFTSQQIDRAVAKCLLPAADVDLSAHQTMLRLARLPNGNTRLITTNFDRLFEACDRKLPSHTRSTLPRLQYADNNWGIVHIHGRLTTDLKSSDRDGLVLTSAQFGDAYLAQGWARDFVREVLQRHVAVFIGYSADDPPMRYLLEGLKEAGGLKHPAYAFQHGDSEEAKAQWRDKDIEALSYGSGIGGDHDTLWRTLEAWGKRASDPAAWRKKVFSIAARGPGKLAPHERGMVSHIVRSAAGARSFAKVTPPLPAEWLCVFDSVVRFAKPDRIGRRFRRGEMVDPFGRYCLDDDPVRPPEDEPYKPARIPQEAWHAFVFTDEDRKITDDQRLPWVRGHYAVNIPRLSPRLDALADWIVRVADQNACIWWAAKQGALHPDIITGVKRSMERRATAPVPEAIKHSWQALFEYHARLPDEDDHQYAFQDEVRALSWNSHTVRRFGQVFAPRLRSDSTYTGPVPPEGSKKLDRSHFVSLSVEYPKNIRQLDVPDAILAPLLRVFRSNIELAVALEWEYGHWADLCAIEPREKPDDDDDDDDRGDGGFTRSYGLSGYVLPFVALFRRLVEHDTRAARFEFRSWRQDDEIFARLRVWACGFPAIVGPSDFADLILGLEDADFWTFKGERDLLLVLRRRWTELDIGPRDQIVERIMQGPPRPERQSKADHTRRSAHWRLSRLFWLAKNGCDLGVNLAKVTARLRRAVPGWQDEWADRAADDNDGRSGTVTTIKDWGVLKDVPLAKAIEVANAQRGRRGYESMKEYDPFRGLCEERPVKALGALMLEIKRGEFSTGYWSSLLEPQFRKQGRSRVNALIAERVCRLPSERLSQILLQAARWFEDCGPNLREEFPALFDRLWTKFIETMSEHVEEAGSALVRQGDEVDWTTEAINSPAGKLVELHMSDSSKKGLDAGRGLPQAWIVRADQLLQLPGDLRRYALAMFAFNLTYFFAVDPSWADKTFLSVFRSNSPGDDDRDALWAGYMLGAKIPSTSLYPLLKPYFIEMSAQPTPRRKRHGEKLSALLLAGWSSKGVSGKQFVSSEELRAVLANSDEDFRSHALWNLETWTRKPNAEDSEQDQNSEAQEEEEAEPNRWSILLPDFLTNVWPKQAKVQTARTSARLVDIALSQGDDFPRVAPLVARMVVPIENEQLFIPQLRRSKDSLASRFPDEMLELLFAILPDNPARWPYGASQALKEIEIAAPRLLSDDRLIELKGRLPDA